MDNSSIKTQLADIFADLSKKSNAEQGSNPVSIDSTTNQAGSVAGTPVVESTPVTPNAEPTTVVTPTTSTTPVTTPDASSDTDGPASGWDVDDVTPVETQAPVTPQVAAPVITDFSDMAKVLGKEKIQSKEELVNAVNEIKSKADVLASLPSDLQKAIEIASLNGNYLEYLGVSVIDWGKEDPITLYENYVINQFTDANGQVDYERVDKLLDKIDEDEKELRGRDLQRQYMNYQASEKNRSEQRARAERQAFEQNVRSAVDSLQDIAGFKLSQAHKAELYNYIVKGEDQKNKDISQRVVNAFITKYFNKIDSFRKSQIRNATKREILENVTIPQLNTSNEPVSTETDKKYDLSNYIKELEQKRR